MAHCKVCVKIKMPLFHNVLRPTQVLVRVVLDEVLHLIFLIKTILYPCKESFTRLSQTNTAGKQVEHLTAKDPDISLRDLAQTKNRAKTTRCS